ncbi:MAG: hypothetical protein M1431_03685 [Candidatus Thermoplasmatota archaeon]|nr:hypothetical protein [Candidatus Thermoplasmatota archaeon]
MDRVTMGLSLTLILEIWIALMVVFFFGFWLGRVMARWKLIKGPMTGKESMIGKIGVVVRNQKSYVEARFDSQLWKIVSDNDDLLLPGTQVKIADIDGNSLRVTLLSSEKSDGALSNSGSRTTQ